MLIHYFSIKTDLSKHTNHSYINFQSHIITTKSSPNHPNSTAHSKTTKNKPLQNTSTCAIPPIVPRPLSRGRGFNWHKGRRWHTRQFKTLKTNLKTNKASSHNHYKQNSLASTCPTLNLSNKHHQWLQIFQHPLISNKLYIITSFLLSQFTFILPRQSKQILLPLSNNFNEKKNPTSTANRNHPNQSP